MYQTRHLRCKPTNLAFLYLSWFSYLFELPGNCPRSALENICCEQSSVQETMLMRSMHL